VEKQAKEAAVDLSLKLLNICNQVGANFNTIENTIRKLKVDNETYLNKLKHITKEKLDNIKPYTPCHDNKITIIQGIFYDLIDSEILLFAGKKITENNVVVIIGNINNEFDTVASIVFARSESLANVDCNRLFKEMSGKDGRGGGKAHFVTGIVNRKSIIEIVSNVVDVINRDNSY
jgi:alanyl-tRNA synthetase